MMLSPVVMVVICLAAACFIVGGCYGYIRFRNRKQRRAVTREQIAQQEKRNKYRRATSAIFMVQRPPSTAGSRPGPHMRPDVHWDLDESCEQYHVQPDTGLHLPSVEQDWNQQPDMAPTREDQTLNGGLPEQSVYVPPPSHVYDNPI